VIFEASLETDNRTKPGASAEFRGRRKKRSVDEPVGEQNDFVAGLTEWGGSRNVRPRRSRKEADPVDRNARGMDPVGTNRTHILILNYNGRDLLPECLPSVVAAAAASSIPCAVSVIDNESTDESVAYLKKAWPGIDVIPRPNRGLASFNGVLAGMDESAVLLLNNDVKLEPDAVGPLLAALADHPDAFFSAPKCWDFDGRSYEGMRTRVRMRFGLVQGMCRVPGHETQIDKAGLTASAGPVLAVDRVKFLALGGYDPIYFPGRIEDLDLGFRGWMAGWRGYYVPESIAYHRGFGSFLPSFGRDGCDRLAARNSLLFSWKNLTGLRLCAHLAWLPARVAHALATGRRTFLSALHEALGRLDVVIAARRSLAVGGHGWAERESAFFREFRW
jgi:N-acetylglucosaminyl-diphospho-decaprenol L-rhamnosyltransferase